MFIRPLGHPARIRKAIELIHLTVCTRRLRRILSFLHSQRHHAFVAQKVTFANANRGYFSRTGNLIEERKNGIADTTQAGKNRSQKESGEGKVTMAFST